MFIPSRLSLSALAVGLSLAYAAAAPDLQGVRGVPNFHSVNDRIYRGGQPSNDGLRSLADAGVKTIVDLREEDSYTKAEKHLAKKLGMHYINIPMQGMHTPSDKKVEHALKVLHDEKAGPVFIHCKRGADRTGVVLACYRMEHDNWSNRQALAEARSYGMSWYQIPLQRYVMGYRPHDSHGIGGGISDAVETLKDLPKKATDLFK